MSPSVPGPVATLDTAVGSIPPRLKVYETFRDSDDALTVHHGVSVLLLDYLVVTALLLVADPNEYSNENSSCSPSRSWKKLIPKDTIFGRRSSSSNQHSALEFSGSISLDQMSKIVYGDPIYPTLTAPEPASATEGENDDSEYTPSSSRPSSPACSSAACASSIGAVQADSSNSRTSSTPPIAALPTLQTAPTRTPSPEELESSPTSLRAPSLSSYSIRRLPAPPQVPPPRPLVRTVPSISPIAPPPLEPPRPLYIQTHRRPHTSAGSTEYSSASPSPSSTRRLPIPPTVSVHGHRLARRKESADELGEWMGAPRPTNDVGMSVVDFPPPPAYNTIDFAVPEDPPMRPLPQAPMQQ